MSYVDAKAVLITRGGAILTVFNERWGSFTLPMTKTRKRPDAKNPAVLVEESPQETAIRAAVEVLGRPLAPAEFPKPHPVLDAVDPFTLSGRDGTVKVYHIELFHIELAEGETPAPLGGVATAWLTPAQVMSHQPVSPTARYVVGKIHPGSSLPDDV